MHFHIISIFYDLYVTFSTIKLTFLVLFGSLLLCFRFSGKNLNNHEQQLKTKNLRVESNEQ